MLEQQSYKLYTNSCIELSIPFEYQQYGSISCNWSTTPFHIYQSYLAQFITSQHLKPKDKQRTFYLCSPLDIGCFIFVRIQKQGSTDSQIIEQIKYGPVQIENTLLSSIQTNNWHRVQLLLNKNKTNNKKQAIIQIQSSQKNTPRQNSYFTISIKINQQQQQHQHQHQQFQFKLKISQQLGKQKLQQFQKYSFFKLYDSQPNAIGIYINHQIVQFENKLKQYKMNKYQSGQYLKIYFQNRLCRDIFMINCIAMTDLNVDSIKQYKNKLNSIQNYNNKTNSSINILISLKNISKQLLKIPKIQTTIRASQIMNNQFLGVSFNQSQSPKIQQDILEDIYNILYTPINKMQRESLQLAGIQNNSNNKSNNGNNNNNNNNSNNSNSNSNSNNKRQKQQQKSIYINQGTSSEITVNNNTSNTITNQQNKIFQQNYQQTQITPKNKPKNYQFPHNFQQSKSQIKKLHSLDTYKKQHHHLHPHTNEQYNHNNNNSHNFKQQLHQINLLQKINQLMKINEDLVTQNKRLRLQNQKLKSDGSRNQKLKQLQKMLEIKEMVQIMAQKLESYQRENSSNNYNNNNIVSSVNPHVFQSKKTMKIQSRKKIIENVKQKQTRQNQSNKRFWSPKTHEQLIKNFKQKNTQQKQRQKEKSAIKNYNTQQQQINRQKSLSHLILNQNSAKSKTNQTKQQPSSIKIPQFLQNQHEGTQRLKNQKIELHQTLQFNDRTKKHNKQGLLGSTRQLHHNYSEININKASNSKNVTPLQNNMKPLFRNVFGQ